MSDYQRDTLLLFVGIGVLLIIASIIGLQLKKRMKSPNSVIDNLNTRINSWWVMVVIIGIAFLLGKLAVIFLFFLASCIALREFLTLTSANGYDNYALMFSYFIALPLQYILVAVSWYGLFSIFIPVYGFLLLAILAAITGSTHNFLERTAEVQWGLMITVYSISCVPALLALNIEHYQDRNLLLIAFLVLVVELSDVLQYVFGKLFGKHPISPNLSPSKTIEGFIGGVLSASLIGACLFWITPFTFIQSGLISLMITLLGFFGGLVMSAIKRDRGIKDWGKIIGGHGGVLDRLDSICFAAPIFFHIVRYYWT
ncbi:MULTISPECIES: phosphatidate cytidylyltransferase [unclassified Gilliamella]|uniref:phosphatidate cytidylyltransferase n=1 Tax=unclassified Gilliamella TaxID=2685620 RepID=UPI001328F194|nr:MULTISPECIES: phosphatidate cytidylyltransferase [unclassified Gilliamella]MWN30896.1 phosphatidate cytidylyltransferase [Gilliamella sp. Pra-s60]MWP28539.1 phosphatidate cytidylyltransferase [Gilliamella sp. Pra-s54]MWP46969.1 phosphatidate cytidylyltransferase [Gilliamella sp. Pas-s27]